MRYSLALPLMAALSLSACGSSDSGTDIADSSGKVSSEDAAAAIKNVEAPLPGLYKTTVEVLEFSIPGIPDSMLAQSRKAFASNAESTRCQKATDPESAAKQMTESLAKGDCTYDTFQVGKNAMNVAMSCAGPDGSVGMYKIDGTLGASGSDMTMTIDQQAKSAASGIGGMHMKAHVITSRVGDCPG